MCGIVGYIGTKDPIAVLIGGLEKLEYRGYDSAGVAVIENAKFRVCRSEGKLSKLKTLLVNEGLLYKNESASSKLQLGIGHTRWATHGKPSETNAHPHTAGEVCLVHNGIIENYNALRERLKKEGCRFLSETDSEVAAHLVNLHLAKTKNLFQAVRQATHELEGSYALVVISTKDPSCLVVARNATPLIIGIGEGENFVASDIPAILEHTREMLVIEDGELALIEANSVRLERDGQTVEREPINIGWDPVTAEKGGYRHFMLKEINEQPQAVTDTLRGRIDHLQGNVFLDNVKLSDDELRQIKHVSIVACGTAWHASLVAKFFLENIARIRTDVDYGSEFRYRQPLIDKDTLFIVVSQSGETADTLGSLTLACNLGAKTLAVCNVLGSTIARRANDVFFTRAGPEISVASTKAFTTQLTALYLLALRLAIVRETLSAEEIAKHLENLLCLPRFVSNALSLDRQIEKIARKYGRSGNFLYIGRGFLYPIALEGALKLKEISYVHAEGYPAGEMKHGPIALIDEETPVVVVLGHDGLNYEKSMSNLCEVAARGGRIIAVTDRETPELQEMAWEILAVGDVAPMMLPMVLTIPLQLLAYHVAIYRGTDVDQPRNLAKSVTVE